MAKVFNVAVLLSTMAVWIYLFVEIVYRNEYTQMDLMILYVFGFVYSVGVVRREKALKEAKEKEDDIVQDNNPKSTLP
jgi:hypothetical protein